MKHATLRWEAYEQTKNMFDTMLQYQWVISIIAANKRVDINSLCKVTKLTAHVLHPILEQLRKHDLIFINDHPFIHKNSLVLEVPCYSVNWKMIRAINKALGKL